MTRVAIIGNAGGGKTALASFISLSLGLPRRSIDDVQWLRGWKPAPLQSVRARHDQWLASGRWVIDGWGPPDLIRERFDAADTIVMIDFPLWRHYWWAAKRHLKSLAGVPQDWPPEGCRANEVTARLFRLMWQVHIAMRRDLLSMLDTDRYRGRVVLIRSMSDLRAFRERVARLAGR